MRDRDEDQSGAQAPTPLPAGLSRREFLRFTGAAVTLLVSPVGQAAASSLIAVRVWPGTEYTRITLEGSAEFAFSHLVVKDPERLVLDLEGIELDSVLQSLSSRVLESDPVIKLIRAGRNRPGVTRVVVELKGEISPQIFTLKPIASYGHRLVVDLYPSEPIDPLLALIRKSSPMEAAAGDDGTVPAEAVADHPTPPEPPSQTAARNAPEANRIFTVVIDAGHGGEDPGAIGRRGTHEKNVTLSIARRLKAKIDAEPNMRAVMTRNGDYFVPLQRRVALARRVQADLFVSIHADAFVRPEARGS
ncbi:MAG: N-acetylmuramoyl-L-alanine amidase, partial [Rhodocyclaceae bacterium]|nr:N-acetylmuramoyl-L-alanine amidase [Rhodocyclaceae bacterium]